MESKRLILSRHVVHNEDEFPYRIASVQDSNISAQSQNARINIVVIQMPIPAIQNQVPQSNSVPIQELQSEYLTETTYQRQTSHKQQESNIRNVAVSPISDLNMQQPSSASTSHHHHSTPTTNESPLMLVYHSSELEVIFHFSPQLNAISETHASTTNLVPHHSMVTRLKSGVIER